MKLDGGARLAATAWVMTRPVVVIRRHRLKVDDLQGWIDRDGVSPACANLLGAAVRAGWSVTVAGPMGAGKTTLVRALCAEIPREEAIGTFETEHELFLGETGNHDIVLDWEARPGVGEIGLNGRAAGSFELSDALNDSFRFNLARQIVGEVRGPEAWTMIKAMESGTGSLSTTHAANAEACVRKLVTCAMEDGPHVTRDLAVEKLTGCLDLIVQLGKRVETLSDGTQVLRRWISEVVLIEPGEQLIGYSLSHLFGPSTSGPARAKGILPPRVEAELTAHGFDPHLYQAEADGRRVATMNTLLPVLLGALTVAGISAPVTRCAPRTPAARPASPLPARARGWPPSPREHASPWPPPWPPGSWSPWSPDGSRPSSSCPSPPSDCPTCCPRPQRLDRSAGSRRWRSGPAPSQGCSAPESGSSRL